MSGYATTGFALPEDGWFHIATPGEWPHKPTGLVQVLDDSAMQSIVDSFFEHSRQPNWPGVLIDFDHQSLDQDKPTVAAGWIIELEKRPTGIWGKIRWSDLGRQSIEGGRYRFISPVWKSSDCSMLDDVKIRPLKLMNCAVTNDPNIKGLFPLSNAKRIVPMRLSAPALPIMNQGITSNYNPRTDPALKDTYQMTDKQRRWWFSQMGGGSGGGGGGGGAGGGASSQSATSEPSEVSGAASANERIKALEQLRDRVEATRPPKPPEHTGYSPLDPDRVEKDALARGATWTEAREARNAAIEENRTRKSELNALKRQIEKQYTTPEARERALARELERQEKAARQAKENWQKKNYAVDKEIERINQNIRQEQKRIGDEANRTRDKQAAAEQKRIAEQIKADKAAERQRQMEERENQRIEEEMKTRPIKEAATERNRLKEYYAAVTRGDMDTATRLYPTADHGKVKSDLARISSANPRSAGDIRAMNKYLKDYQSRLPPGVSQ